MNSGSALITLKHGRCFFLLARTACLCRCLAQTSQYLARPITCAAAKWCQASISGGILSQSDCPKLDEKVDDVNCQNTAGYARIPPATSASGGKRSQTSGATRCKRYSLDLPMIRNAVQQGENVRKSLGSNYKSAALPLTGPRTIPRAPSRGVNPNAVLNGTKSIRGVRTSHAGECHYVCCVRSRRDPPVTFRRFR
jgi:hypothetical protein